MHKKFLVAAAGVFTVLSLLIFVVAQRAVGETEQIVSDQFNNQQLIIAQKIASDISLHFSFLETALLTFARGSQKAMAATEDPLKDADPIFHALPDWNVAAMGFLPQEEDLPRTIVEGHEIREEPGLDLSFYEQWAAHPHNRGKVFIGQALSPQRGPFQHMRVMVMATPSYLLPADQEDSLQAPRFIGLSFFIVNAMDIAERYTRNVRSGKTGYAWVLDQEGVFLSHHEQSFVGRDHIRVRQERNPLISFERINELAKNHLLRGEEGTDSYISGWHRGVIAEMKKFLAYSPVVLQNHQDMTNLWSVGVVAPAEEVSGLLRDLLIRQWTLVGLLLFVVFVALSMLLFVSLRWSQTLTEEVEKKTEHLRRSEGKLQRETEQLKESMAELVETREKLIRSERFAAIGEAAAHLSHEIKNPLMLIGGFARQVSRSFPENDPNQKKLKIIAEETGRLESLLNDVKDFTRPSRPQKNWSSLHGCVHRTLELMEDETNERKVQFETNLPENPPLVWCDPRQIRQVLINLVKNAMEAVPEGGKITISSGWDEKRVWVAVANSAKGMPEEVLNNLFKPFFTTKKKGTGLGLAVCHKIIEDHHGEITVWSREGRGTTFTFYLPLKTDDAEAQEEEKQD